MWFNDFEVVAKILSEDWLLILKSSILDLDTRRRADKTTQHRTNWRPNWLQNVIQHHHSDYIGMLTNYI